MKVQDIKDVLTFVAFLPEPDDSSANWKKRFASRKSLLMDVGKSRVFWMGLGKGGKFQEVGKVDGELKELFTQSADEWKKLTDGGWCGVSINSRYVISLENNLSRKKGAEEILKTNPRAALGSKYERGKRYAVTHNPESSSSLLLALDEEFIKKIETLCKEAGLSVARVCCGTYALLRHLLVEVSKKQPKGQPLNADAGVIYVVCNHGSVCILSQRGEQWLELRSRTDVYEDDPKPVLELLEPFKQQLPPPLSVYLLMDELQPDFSGAIINFFDNVPVEDLTHSGQLWELLRDF